MLFFHIARGFSNFNSIETFHSISDVIFIIINFSSKQLAVQALKLTQLSIEHFLAPNLALLVEDLQGSGMERLGATVVKRLHDIHWEVRDSTLELLTAMSKIAIFSKYKKINFESAQPFYRNIFSLHRISSFSTAHC